MIVQPKIVQKGWGEEVWIHNDEEYCGKLLRFFKAGNKFSLHYHIKKKESWYVGKGSFTYIYLDLERGIEVEKIIKVGTCLTIDRQEPHQLIALEDMSEIFEVSTQHFDEDSYRIRKGDTL
jgi:mannose-6-phosphate isomerase-like protein (cupin superfamily)|tara:strand:+ start:5285 stop:5647 length:363 start_codon:yes stop_codon:yes gene_type:complete